MQGGQVIKSLPWGRRCQRDLKVTQHLLKVSRVTDSDLWVISTHPHWFSPLNRRREVTFLDYIINCTHARDYCVASSSLHSPLCVQLHTCASPFWSLFTQWCSDAPIMFRILWMCLLPSPADWSLLGIPILHFHQYNLSVWWYMPIILSTQEVKQKTCCPHHPGPCCKHQASATGRVGTRKGIIKLCIIYALFHLPFLGFLW